MTAAVITLASRQPRCLHCRHWEELRKGHGWCYEFDEPTTEDYPNCTSFDRTPVEFRRKEQANG